MKEITKIKRFLKKLEETKGLCFQLFSEEDYFEDDEKYCVSLPERDTYYKNDEELIKWFDSFELYKALYPRELVTDRESAVEAFYFVEAISDGRCPADLKRHAIDDIYTLECDGMESDYDKEEFIEYMQQITSQMDTSDVIDDIIRYGKKDSINIFSILKGLNEELNQLKNK